MKNRVGLIILTVICVGLVVALIINQNRATTQRSSDTETIAMYSNRLEKTSATLNEYISVNTVLTNELDTRIRESSGLSNRLDEVSASLNKTRETLKATQDEVARRDARIAELEAQNEALDLRTADLSTAITNLTSQIEDTQRRLAASEGDKAFLEKELARLMAEKAELERQFNDLTILRAQVAKLKEELNIARRLQWIREGLFARTEQKGAQQLMQKSTAPESPAARQARQQSYDLNVEISADGSVRVIPPTNAPASTAPSPQ